MFEDPNLVGSWPNLVTRLNDGGVARWACSAPALRDLDDVEALLAAWADPARTHAIGAALIEQAAVDGGRDDDALLLLLHLLSGVVWRLSTRLRDLSPDITSIVLSELTCQIRTYRWRVRRGGLVSNLEWDTRRTVLADLRPSDRYHPDRVEQLTWDGDLRALHADVPHGDDIDVVDLLLWAAAAGVDRHDLHLLVESERARGQRGAQADTRVAAEHGLSRRWLLERRKRALTALRAVAPAYLDAVA